MDMLRTVLVPIHGGGDRFIALFAFATLLLFWLWQPLGWIGLALTVWCTCFFRDPPRVTPVREGLIVSPADGVVQMIEDAVPPAELGMGPEPLPRISVFMNVFNVHVNRCPADGEITALASLDVAAFDALVIPGGFGAAKNLCNHATVAQGDKAKLVVEPAVERAVAAFAAQGKPIGLCCIAPVIAAALIPGVRVTVGRAEGEQWPYGGTVGDGLSTAKREPFV